MLSSSGKQNVIMNINKWKERYVADLNNNSRFAIFNCFAINIIAFKLFDRIADAFYYRELPHHSNF